MTDDIEIKDGKIIGGWRAPENLYRGDTTSIHDDNTAKRVGMRGGTIPGTIHLSMFAPLVQKIFGDHWFERGSVSMYYTFATVDKEEVRTIIELPPDGIKNNIQVKAWAELKNGQQVMTGTVSCGDSKEPSYLEAIELKNSKPEDLRILAGFKVGDALETEEVLVTQEDATRGLRSITDHLDYYKENSPWGNAILSPTAMFNAMAMGSNKTSFSKDKAVPFFGATEVRSINGPVMVGVPYIAKGKFVSIGVSRKTEYFWHDTTLEEKKTGKIVASLRHMNRFMKAGSPLYKDQ